MLWIVNGYGEDLVPEVDAAESLDESRRFWPTGWPNLREGGESRVWDSSAIAQPGIATTTTKAPNAVFICFQRS